MLSLAERIDKQHAQLAGTETQEVDDAHAALLAHAGARLHLTLRHLPPPGDDGTSLCDPQSTRRTRNAPRLTTPLAASATKVGVS